MKNKNLEYFIGKICTVFTTSTNRDFALEGPNYLQQLMHYFLGTIEAIDDDGVLSVQTNGLKVFTFKQHLVAIAEEEVLDPDNPEDAKVIQTITQEPESKINTPECFDKPDIKIPDFLNIESITTIADNLKENFGKQSK